MLKLILPISNGNLRFYPLVDNQTVKMILSVILLYSMTQDKRFNNKKDAIF